MCKKFFLIDGHAQIFQSYYAIPQLSSPSGAPVNAVYGFTSALRKLIKNQNPDYLAVAFDVKGPTFRHKCFEEYKSNRKPMPEDLAPQIQNIERVVKAYNIPIFVCEGYEADDVIGTIVKKVADESVETAMVSRDKDLEQLMNEKVKMFNTQTNAFYDVEKLAVKRGIKPSQMTDLLALVGDRSDNVPGVPGIGDKTALKLVKEWGSVECALDNADKITARKVKENLKQYADQARLSKFLVTINTEVPIDFSLEACRVNGVNEQEVYNLFQEFGFTSFLR